MIERIHDIRRVSIHCRQNRRPQGLALPPTSLPTQFYPRPSSRHTPHRSLGSLHVTLIFRDGRERRCAMSTVARGDACRRVQHRRAISLEPALGSMDLGCQRVFLHPRAQKCNPSLSFAFLSGCQHKLTSVTGREAASSKDGSTRVHQCLNATCKRVQKWACVLGLQEDVCAHREIVCGRERGPLYAK